MAKLNNAALKRLIQKTGRHADGGGLYFRVLGAGRAYWAFRYRVDGKAREMSLGSYPEVNLAEARDRHGAERTKVRTHKRDPLAEKRAAKQARANASWKPTFGEIADDHLRAHQDTRKNEGHRRQWFVALTRYCAPIRDLPVDAIDTEAVLRVLQPVWTRAPTPARACSDDAAHGRGADTVHGFRSAFRNWAGDNGVDFEIAEACLADAVGNSVTRAYPCGVSSTKPPDGAGCGTFQPK